MPTPTVEDLNVALMTVMQKHERRILAQLGKDAKKMVQETDYLTLACDEYNNLVDRAPTEVLEQHRHEIPTLQRDNAA